jgi:hypothetical protein
LGGQGGGKEFKRRGSAALTILRENTRPVIFVLTPPTVPFFRPIVFFRRKLEYTTKGCGFHET